MNMSMNLIDITSFLILLALIPIAIKQRSFVRLLRENDPIDHKISLWLAFIGLILSTFFIGLALYRPSSTVIQLLLGSYGFTTYAVFYRFCPYFRFHLKMPWRTSIRLYLLFSLIGLTVVKIAGFNESLAFCCILSASAALGWRRYSITQTIVMIVQLLLTLLTLFFWDADQIIWGAIWGVMGNMIIFILGPYSQSELQNDSEN